MSNSPKPGPSVLDATPSLRETADRDALRELCGTLGAFLAVGIEIRDLDGEVFVPATPLPGREIPSQQHEVELRIDLDPVGVAIVGFPTAARPERDRVLRFLRDTLELFLFQSLKSHLAARLHVEATETSFRDLEASYEKLKALDRMKSNFLATVSHELRTPLTSILGYGEMVVDGLAGKIPPAARRHVETIVRKGEQLLTLINSILDVTKVESGRMDLALDGVRVDRLVQDALASVRPQASHKKLALSIRIAKGLPEILGDEYKLRQVLVNLLSNAVKFTPEGGRIRVEAVRRGKSADAALVVSVADTGIGIPEPEQSRVFERFYQVDNSSTRKYGGTGLGLPIVKSFVEMHGGTVRIESEPGRGTTVFVELPWRKPERSTHRTIGS